jgi:hypothetical protein
MKIILPLFLLFGLLFASCSPTYRANTVNTPLLKTKGDVQLSLSASYKSADLQANYAINRYLGALASVQLLDNHLTKDTMNRVKGYYAEMGLGGYKLAETDMKCINIFGGAGFAQTVFTERTKLKKSDEKISFVKFFIQPDLNFRVGNSDSHFIFSTRLAYIYGENKYDNYRERTNSSFINFINLFNIGSGVPATISSEIKHSQGTTSFQNFLFEPSFTYLWGADALKFKIQVLKSGTLSYDIAANTLFFNAGVTYRFNIQKK